MKVQQIGYLILSAAVGAADEMIKRNIKNVPVKNKGFAMNRFDDHQRVVAGVSAAMTAGAAAALICLPKEYRPGLSLILGGALSNTRDRLVRKYVVDYLKIGRVYYNLSDFAIFAGAVLLVLASAEGGEK